MISSNTNAVPDTCYGSEIKEQPVIKGSYFIHLFQWSALLSPQKIYGNHLKFGPLGKK
jgi:hypothetical protein